ncbi:hypothetical protein ASD11_06770 [Aeromicrobium sp. Root495]|nr:hypothetical protein ASD11_06770 [Aeromicrobium sp. Root495]
MVLPVAALSGLLCAAAFDPWNVPLAMVLGVAVLFALLRRLGSARKRLVLGSGFVYGLAFMGPLIWWMRAVSDGAYVGLVIFEALFLAVILFALRATARLRAWPLWTAAAWVLGEWARGTFPFSGFPWGRLVHTSIDTPFAPFVRLVGMPATSFLLALLAACLVLVVTASWRTRLTAAAVVAVTTLVGLVLPTGVAQAQGERVFAVVQGDVPGEFLTWKRGEIFQLHAQETARLASDVAAGRVQQPDVVLWPENATDTDPFHDEPVRTQIEALSASLRAPILVGGIYDGPTSKTALNAGVVWSADGPGERYVKRKVVVFGEYVPFRNLLGPLVPILDRDIPRDMLPGDESGALSVVPDSGRSVMLGDTICWDIAYDGIVRQAVGDDAEVLVVQTSNASFTGTSQPEQQWKISRLRAIETGRYVLVPSTNGISGVVDADGNVVERAPLHEPATIVKKVPLAHGSTPAQHLELPLQIALVTLGLAGWILGVRRGTVRQDHAGEDDEA